MMGFRSVKAYNHALVVQMTISAWAGTLYLFTNDVYVAFVLFGYCAMCSLILSSDYTERRTPD